VTLDEATEAWLRYLRKIGPRIDDAVLRWIAGLLAGDVEPLTMLFGADAPLMLAADLMVVAEVVRAEVQAGSVPTPA
jgi:hypothetical protein